MGGSCVHPAVRWLSCGSIVLLPTRTGLGREHACICVLSMPWHVAAWLLVTALG